MVAATLRSGQGGDLPPTTGPVRLSGQPTILGDLLGHSAPSLLDKPHHVRRDSPDNRPPGTPRADTMNQGLSIVQHFVLDAHKLTIWTHVNPVLEDRETSEFWNE